MKPLSGCLLVGMFMNKNIDDFHSSTSIGNWQPTNIMIPRMKLNGIKCEWGAHNTHTRKPLNAFHTVYVASNELMPTTTSNLYKYFFFLSYSWFDIWKGGFRLKCASFPLFQFSSILALLRVFMCNFLFWIQYFIRLGILTTNSITSIQSTFK